MRSVAFCVDDDISSLMIIEEYCREINIDVYCFTNAKDAIDRLKYLNPDIIITDYYMPAMNGIVLCEKIRSLDLDIPIVMFTSKEYDYDVKLKALDAGVSEFLEKPFNIVEFKIRVKNLVTLRRYSIERKDRLVELRNEVENVTYEVKNRELETLKVLINITQHRERDTADHVVRVGHLSKVIAKLLKYDRDTCNTIFYAAQLHDIGKFAIEDNILFKHGKLTEDEYEKIKKHAQVGYDILCDNKSEYLKMGAIASLNHHERYDGTGYPLGLKGKNIPIWGRIVAIADVFDALKMKRVYKESWNENDVIEYMIKMKGKQFDPDLIDLILNNIDEFTAIYYK